MKNLISKTASGKGRFSRCRFAYNPVAGDLKSGIPAEVDIPAPVRITIFFAIHQLCLEWSREASSPLPEVIRSANLFIAESPAASIGVFVGRGGEDVGVVGASAFLIGKQDP